MNLELDGNLVILIIYAVLAGTYLLVMPAIVYAYLNMRWYVVSSFERGFMYFLMFFFFPGMLVLSPFLNFRPRRRQIEG
ncbi:MAG: NAD(P)H-quinone oxidoreductase subunit L [Okeania sp. SIO2C2]|uniref:NAD(P)H-quinone oxidoreductase subunit L n=1 Tax=unclassified Okeania TaxID=2634635 RepID=UPI0013BE51A5|nr:MULTISPECIES: NAD(P)H-quinone oxidoreductase subunit L [unclassified Okeania]NEP04282.1 NAD(P)H-quinone oxidoreductase subunit L [Okeania sp. SIO4D6]NEP70666.1 NAD(P)H-quinone oxidoreductase subunit L [Okeania sp. SIO2G5]NEP86271.1 NAD(P)H-quinone oxidoreductase subunit L [Okeania sp. SIO2C2]NEP91911.1 NAD(P)H-quinone oxidoreductase subunit L [Okeania sp. SIO2F5]NEQ89334.1 NAD(P)H-quinone oxidoreductase subunit L [Okeania sp. SIO2G4]